MDNDSRPELDEYLLIRLPERFVLTIRGNIGDWVRNSVPHSEMAYMLTRLFYGQSAARSTFKRWNMTVEVEEDVN